MGLMSICLMLLFLTVTEVRCQATANEAVFDVTNYNATEDADTDNAMALIRTWVAACKSSGLAKVLIPEGNFIASEVIFAGPCNATKSITIEILGNLHALSDLSNYAGDGWITIENVKNVVVTGNGTIDGHGPAVWKYSTSGDDGVPLPTSLVLTKVRNVKVNYLKLVDSMGGHMKVRDATDVDISKLTIKAPDESPNTDGIHVSNSSNVKIVSSVIKTGDDCVSIGDGTENILVTGVICGPGHGLSIGSLGKDEGETNLKRITVRDSTLIGTKNGARIKTYHQSPKLEATNITFENLVMKKVKNPIIIDQHYDSKTKPEQSSVRLSDVHFRNIKGTSISKVAININCSSLVPCQKVEISNVYLKPFNSSIESTTAACASADIYTRGTNIPALPTRCLKSQA